MVAGLSVSPLRARLTLSSGGLLLRQWRRVFNRDGGELHALPLSLPAYQLHAPPPHATPRSVRNKLVWHYSRHLLRHLLQRLARVAARTVRWWLPVAVLLLALAVTCLLSPRTPSALNLL